MIIIPVNTELVKVIRENGLGSPKGRGTDEVLLHDIMGRSPQAAQRLEI